VVLTEYFPRDQHEAFCRTLAAGGLVHQVLTREPPERANRVLVASRAPLVSDPLPLPNFDHQLPANLVAVGVPSLGLQVLGVRLPAYPKASRNREEWPIRGTFSRNRLSVAARQKDFGTQPEPAGLRLW
jgi:hypothetical protein